MAIVTSCSFLFWQRWLYYTSLVFAFAGILFAFFGDSVLFSSYNKLLAQVFWHQSEMPVEGKAFIHFMYKPFGGTIACCYILLAFIARYPFKEKKVWARNAIIIGFGCWVIIDTIGCLYANVYPQIYFINTFSILVKALPIVFTWNYFSTK
ncbi:MAG: hypothetical protein V4651_14700 [Bacteroidota bacterium]